MIVIVDFDHTCCISTETSQTSLGCIDLSASPVRFIQFIVVFVEHFSFVQHLNDRIVYWKWKMEFISEVKIEVSKTNKLKITLSIVTWRMIVILELFEFSICFVGSRS